MMIILSSPSGAGKTTLTRLLSEKNKNLEISISHTTRVPRENEIDGRDYYFTNKDEFKKLIEKNSFFEYATVFNNYYGTSKKTATDKLTEDQQNQILKTIPVSRFGTAEDIASACVYLSSDEASYITGSTIHINGGMGMF